MEPKAKKPNFKAKRRAKESGKRSKYSTGKEVETETSGKRSDNNPEWYTVNGQLLKDVSSFSFNNALGANIKVRGTGIDGTSKVYNTRIPGVMSIFTVPTIGVSNGNDAPVNIAARNIYSYVRHANSGHSNYDPADLMIYLLAMDSIYTYWSYLTRIYGTAQVYSQTNRYVGDAYLRAMGVDPYSVRSNLADLRSFINMFAVKASVFCVPKTMTYFVRHSWMYSNIYKDEDVSKAQVYMYNPAFLYKFSFDAGGAGMLSAIPVAAALATSGTYMVGTAMRGVGDLQMIGWELLNALMMQEDTGIMSGDILKAYGAENLWKLNQLPEDYAVFPVFSEEVLAQIHNTDFASYLVQAVDPTDPTKLKSDYHGLDITQDTSVGGGNLVFNPRFAACTHLYHDRILDFWHENPSPEDIMVATRNKLAGHAETVLAGGNRPSVIDTCGSEIPMCAFIWTLNDAGTPEATQVYATDTGNATMSISKLSKFNEYPSYYIVSATSGEIADVVGEMDTYTTLTSWEVSNLHTTALLSMFGVPYVK